MAKGNGNGNGRNTSDDRDQARNERPYPTFTIPLKIDDSESEVTTGTGGGDDGGMSRSVDGALRQVLGWNPAAKDPRGFVGALNQAFELHEVEGHTEFKWKERTFAVFTDLEGGVTGAQASVYTRAKHAVAHAVPLLDGLYTLAQDSDSEEMDSVKALIRQHLHDLVAELGRHGGPRVLRVDQTLDLLLGQDQTRVRATIAINEPGTTSGTPRPVPLQTAAPGADEIAGELGRLREELGLRVAEGKVNTVREEENQTNYRILADYVIGLRLAWLGNRDFFRRGTSTTPFFGTQLIHLSRLLAVIAEQVREVRFAFNSVFIGPKERQTLELVPRWPERCQGYLPPSARPSVDPASVDLADVPPTIKMPRRRDRGAASVELYVFTGAMSLQHIRSLMDRRLSAPAAASGATPPATSSGDRVLVVKGDRQWEVLEADPIYLEELLTWIDTFAREEGPRLIKDGGKLGVAHAFVPTAIRLKQLVAGIREPKNRDELPAGYDTLRVEHTLFELEKHFDGLLRAAGVFKYESEEGYDDRSDPPPSPPPTKSSGGAAGGTGNQPGAAGTTASNLSR